VAWAERYVDSAAAGGGDGTTAATSGANGAWTLAEAIAAAAAGQRVNVKAGTYTNTTTGRRFAVAGTTTSPVWWRGYNTTIGDRDTDPTLTPPKITFTTGLCTFGGTHQLFSHLDVSGANTGRQLSVSGANLKLDRCRVENTNAAAASSAVTNTTSGTNTFSRCWFKATATATRVFQNGAVADFLGCVWTGGGVGIDSTTAIRLIGCVFRATGSHGFQAITTGSIQQVVGCTFRGCGGDGVRLDVLPTSIVVVANCLFAGCSGYGLNNNTGANTNVVTRFGNDYWSNTSGTENGFGDSPSPAQLSESADPHTSATVLSLVGTAAAKAGGQPGLFENEAYTSYADVGAVQRQEAGGTSGPFSRIRLGM
jgi:hypothetical protein